MSILYADFLSSIACFRAISVTSPLDIRAISSIISFSVSFFITVCVLSFSVTLLMK